MATAITESPLSHITQTHPNTLPFTMTQCNYDQFLEKTEERQGFVFVGCRNPLNWINELDNYLPNKYRKNGGTYENEFLVLTTVGGRRDLVYIFKKETIISASLCTWRIRFGDCVWITDYKKKHK